jgi:hypothetical protein
MLSGLLPVFREKRLIHWQTGTEEAEAISSSAAIRINTSRLPKAFREKFRLGNRGIKQDRVDGSISDDTSHEMGYSRANGEHVLPSGIIDESEGDIRITRFDLELRDQMALVAAIQNNRKTENGDCIESFFENFTKKPIPVGRKSSKKCKFVMYLEVGDGVYWHLERFERLIIARDGEIEKSLVCGGKGVENGGENFDQSTSLRGKFEAKIRHIGVKFRNGMMAIGDYFASDDSNIQNELETNHEFCNAFYEGEAKIIVYHRAVQSLTSLCFERHDERVAAIDRRRDFFIRSKSVIGFAICALVFYIIGHMVSPIPLLGNYLGMVCRLIATVTMGMGLYRGYQLFPMPWQVGMGNFMGTKIGSHLPVFRIWRRRVKTAGK